MYSISKQFKHRRSTTCKYSAIFFVKGISEFVTTQLRDRNIYKSQGESREIFFQEGEPEKYNWKTYCWRSHCIHLPKDFLGKKRIFCIYYWKKLPNWILREDFLPSAHSLVSKNKITVVYSSLRWTPFYAVHFTWLGNHLCSQNKYSFYTYIYITPDIK